MVGLGRGLVSREPRRVRRDRVGRYELLQPLGAGGMAELFRARATGPAGFEREVVIKRILPTHREDAEFIRMFEDEARILGLMHHPNVVEAYDFGEEGGAPYLALEYVDGPSLSRVLRTLRSTNRNMSPAIAAFIARDLCRALDYVHNLRDANGVRLDVIHRDVTPSNIVLASTGTVKLLDFGVASFRAAAQLSRTGTVKGKPAYLAPEQLEGKDLDGRVDLFALGIVLHEMLSLQHLFAGDSDFQTAKKVVEMPIPSLSAKRDDVPPELEAIVMRALQRDRRQRFSSAAEMARALDEVVVASGLRHEDVVAFIREITEASRVAVRPVSAPAAVARHVRVGAAVGRASGAATVRERARLSRRARRRRRGQTRVAFVAVTALLAALGLGTAFGWRTGGPTPSTAVAAAAVHHAAP